MKTGLSLKKKKKSWVPLERESDFLEYWLGVEYHFLLKAWADPVIKVTFEAKWRV